MAGLASWAKHSKALGFTGMGCVHPSQIDIIRSAFTPDATQIQQALRIVEAFDQAEAAGLGVVSLGSKMIDPPVVKQAVLMVKQARDLGLISADTKADDLLKESS